MTCSSPAGGAPERPGTVEDAEYFRILIENATDIVTVLEADGRFRYASPSMQSVLGYRREELLGLNAFELIHPDDTAAIRGIFDQTVRVPQSTATGEFRFRHRDGSWRVLDGVGKNLLYDPRIAGVVVNSRDVTDRRAAEGALRRSNDALAMLIEASPLAITAIDLKSTVLHWNAAAEQLFGWTKAEVMGRRLPTVPPEKTEEHRAVIEHITRGITVTAVETHRLTKAGPLVDVSISAAPLRDPAGAVYATMAVFVDMTEGKAAERRIAASERKFRAIFEHTSDATFLMTRDRFLDCNPGALELFGCTREEILERGPADFSPARQSDGRASRALGEERVDEALAGRPQFFEWTCQRFDGTPFEAEISLSQLGIEGEPLVLATLRDVTVRRRAAEELREANQRLTFALDELHAAEGQASQQERLRALGTMSSGVAHDFNNALTCILGFTELLLASPERIPDLPTTVRYLQLIHTSAKDAAGVVKRLRDFYRHRDTADLFIGLDVNLIVGEAVSLTEPKWRSEAEARGVPLAVNCDLQLVPDVGGDPAELREVLTNLLFNAVDAMPKGGVITVRTCHEAPYVVLEVRDTGMGMTEEVRRRCLDPFFTTKGEHGTGLGLSIVYGSVRRHGGTLEIQSHVGIGSTFRISLPAHCLPVAGAGAGDVAPGRARRPLQVLLVEDQGSVREIIGAYLRMDGHRVAEAADGLEALDLLGRPGRSFDLVLMDRAMPRMGGDELALRVKAGWPSLPVIMLTGFGAMMEATGERPPCVDVVVAKPVSIETLRAAFASVAPTV